MARLKVHFEGWVALPAEFRRQLGVGSGGEIEAQLIDGTVVLRSAVSAKGSTRPERAGMAEMAAAGTPAPSVLAAEPEHVEPEPATPPAAKRRGRPPKIRP